MPSRPAQTALAVLLCLVAALGAELTAWPAPAAAQATEADVYVAQAILSYDARRYDEALGYLKEALALDPKNAEAHYYTGLVYQAQQKPREAAAALEKARAESPQDLAIVYQLGLAYFALKEYGKAEAPLEQVYKVAPKTDGVGYYVGFIRYRKGDYKGALEALRAGVSSDPDTVQATRIYTSLALAKLGQGEQAKVEAEQAALVPGATIAPTNVTDRLRQSVGEAAEAERRFHADLRFGVLYDTNVALLPRPSRDPAAEAVRQKRPTHSFGELYGVGLSYTFLKLGPWESTLGYSFFRINYNDEPQFNTNNHLFFINGSYKDTLLGMPWQLGAEYAYDDTTLAGDAFLSRHTATGTWALRENAANISQLQVRYQDKDFSQIDNDVKFGRAKDLGAGLAGIVPPTPLTAEFRSATNWLFGVAHAFLFEGGKHYIRLGFQYDAEKADGRNYSYDGFRYLVGGQYTLPWLKIRAKYDFDLHQRYYRNENTILNNDAAFQPNFTCHRCPFTREREDTEQNHTITFELPLPYNMTLTLQQLFTAVNSNIDLFAFDRNVTTLSLSWRY